MNRVPVLIACTILAVTGCSGGGSNGARTFVPSPPPTTVPFSSVTVPVSITVPSAATGTALRRQYLSTGTQSVSVMLSTVNGSPISSPASTVIATGAGSPNCQASAAGRTCTGTVTGGIGSDVFNVGTYASANGTGTALSSGPIALTGVTAQNPPTLLISTATAGSLAAQIAKIVAIVSPASLPVNSAGTATLVINEEDASGAAFVGAGALPEPLDVSVTGATGAISLTLPNPGATPNAFGPAYPASPAPVLSSAGQPIAISYDGSGSVLPQIRFTVATQSGTAQALQAVAPLSFSGYPTPAPAPAATLLYVLYLNAGVPGESGIAVFNATASGQAVPVATIRLGYAASGIAVDHSGNVYITNTSLMGIQQYAGFRRTHLIIQSGQAPSGTDASFTISPESNQSGFGPLSLNSTIVGAAPTSNFGTLPVWTDSSDNVYTTGNSGAFYSPTYGYIGGIFGYPTSTAGDTTPALAFDTDPTYTDESIASASGLANDVDLYLKAGTFDAGGYLYLGGSACSFDEIAGACNGPYNGGEIDVFAPGAGFTSALPASIRHFSSASSTANLNSFGPYTIDEHTAFAPAEAVLALAIDSSGNIYASQYHNTANGTVQSGTINVYGGGPNGPSEAAPLRIITSPALNNPDASWDLFPQQDDALPIALGFGNLFVANPITSTINVFPQTANGAYATPPGQFVIDPTAFPHWTTPIGLAVGPGT